MVFAESRNYILKEYNMRLKNDPACSWALSFFFVNCRTMMRFLGNKKYLHHKASKSTHKGPFTPSESEAKVKFFFVL